jgi:hypothetical protein
MAERVRYTIEGGVADVRLNRPEKRNAIDLAMFHALIDAGEALRGDSTLRAVVLSGEGKSFCAGLDVGVFASMSGEKGEGAGAFVAGALAHRGDEIASVAQHAVTIWGSVEVPVVAAVHGHAFGGGLQLALGADIRIVAPDAQLSVLEIRWGLIPDMTATQVLPALVGLDVAKELTFTGRTVPVPTPSPWHGRSRGGVPPRCAPPRRCSTWRDGSGSKRGCWRSSAPSAGSSAPPIRWRPWSPTSSSALLGGEKGPRSRERPGAELRASRPWPVISRGI